MKLLLVAALSVFFLNGCSLFSKDVDASTDNTAAGLRTGGAISERGHTVDVLRPTSDVAGIVPGRRHTLGYPNKYDRQVKTPSYVPNKVRMNAKVVASNDKPKSLWDRYCTGEFISVANEKLLESQPTPAKWIDRCRPIK